MKLAQKTLKTILKFSGYSILTALFLTSTVQIGIKLSGELYEVSEALDKFNGKVRK